MGLNKYHGETGGPQHNNVQLNWPGTLDGFPTISMPGAMADLKQSEVEEILLQYDYKSQMFCLWEPQEKAAFDDINDKIVNGWYRLLKRTDHWNEDKNHLRVWIEWYQIYGVIPTKKG